MALLFLCSGRTVLAKGGDVHDHVAPSLRSEKAPATGTAHAQDIFEHNVPKVVAVVIGALLLCCVFVSAALALVVIAFLALLLFGGWLMPTISSSEERLIFAQRRWRAYCTSIIKC